MKTIILLFTSLLMSLTTVTASETYSDKKGKHLNATNRYRYAQPIRFVERGVEFLVFPDGSFDFNTNFETTPYNDSYYRTRRSKRRNANTTYGAPDRYVKHTSYKYRNRGVSISHDRHGNVRRIGNVYLNYDRHGKLKRAGSVYMNYSHGHHTTLNQVGGMRIKYNHWGEIVNTHGQVNRYSDYCNFCGVSSCLADHSYGNRQHDDHDWYDDVYQNDDNYYYYKQNGKIKKSKRR